VQYSLFPNFVFFRGFGFPLIYRYRPDGRNPESCLIDLMFLAPYPEDAPRPAAAEPFWLEGEDWREAPGTGLIGPIFNQDMPNLARMQKGLKGSRKPGVTFSLYQEVRIRHHAATLTTYLDGAQPA
jgi:hypothetical protein